MQPLPLILPEPATKQSEPRRPGALDARVARLALVPDAVAPGGPDFTLTVNGTGFVPHPWPGVSLPPADVLPAQPARIVPGPYSLALTHSLSWGTAALPGGTDRNADTCAHASSRPVDVDTA